MIALLLMQKIFAMFLMMLVGFVLVRLKTFRPEESLVLSRIVVLLVMPCVAIKAFQSITPNLCATAFCWRCWPH